MPRARPAAVQYTPRRRSGPTRRAHSDERRAPTSTITRDEDDRRRAGQQRRRAPATTSQPMPGARRMLPAASSAPKTMSPSSATMPSRLRLATMPSIGPAVEQQRARPVERHRQLVVAASKSGKFGSTGSRTKIATHSSKSEREREHPLDRAAERAHEPRPRQAEHERDGDERRHEGDAPRRARMRRGRTTTRSRASRGRRKASRRLRHPPPRPCRRVLDEERDRAADHDDGDRRRSPTSRAGCARTGRRAP